MTKRYAPYKPIDDTMQSIGYNPRTRLWEVTWRSFTADGRPGRPHFIVAYRTKREANAHLDAICLESPLYVYLNGNYAALHETSPRERMYRDYAREVSAGDTEDDFEDWRTLREINEAQAEYKANPQDY